MKSLLCLRALSGTLAIKPSLTYLYSLFQPFPTPNSKPQKYQNPCSSLAKQHHSSEPLLLLFSVSRRHYLLHYLTSFINKVLLKPFYPLSPFSICSHIDLKCTLYWIIYIKDNMKHGENIGFSINPSGFIFRSYY